MNKEQQQLLSYALAAIMAFSVCGMAAEKKIRLTIASNNTTAHPAYPAIEDLAKELKEKSGGNLEMIIAFSGAMGSDREITEAVMNGGVEMMYISDIGMGAVIPKLAYVNLPYLFKSRKEAEDIYHNGWMGERFRQTLLENNIVVVGGMMETDFRWMSNSRHPIQKPEDLANLKMRVVESPMYVKFFEHLGCLPVGMSISEVAAALQQKVIDGQDNGPITTYTFGLHEFQPYMTMTNHAYASLMFSINKDVLEEMSSSQRAVFEELVGKYSAICYENIKKGIDQRCREMEATGMTIIDTTPDLSEFMLEAAKKVWADTTVTRLFDQEVVARILSGDM
ncbi:MAG: TRAP transporter substrate-binding protein [Planctomycetaceae bacterium]|nr:TRAP transporter substrate-binding protein [Planctomycetaceae bacterium]